MDITIYLPDELGQWAKSDPSVNLSRMLRDELESLRAERRAVAKAISDAKPFKREVEDKDGRRFKLRFTGVRLAVENRRDVEVFLTDDERVLVYDGEKLDYSVVDDAEGELRDLLADDQYIDVMNALGITPEIDLASD